MEISEVNLNLTSVDGSKTAVLERIALDRTEVKAGETFEVQAFVANRYGQNFRRRKFPSRFRRHAGRNAAGHRRRRRLASADAASRQFVPKNLGELIKTINEIKKNDRLYVQTYRVTNGAIIGANEMPNLPPSDVGDFEQRPHGRRFQADGSDRSDRTGTRARRIYVITGQQVLTIEVTK